MHCPVFMPVWSNKFSCVCDNDSAKVVRSCCSLNTHVGVFADIRINVAEMGETKSLLRGWVALLRHTAN